MVLFRKKLSRTTLLAQLDSYSKAGIVARDVLDIVKAAIMVEDKQVRDIMIPRGQMVSVSLTDSQQEVLHTLRHSSHSRFPVFSKDQEDIIGILHAKDVLRNLPEGEPPHLLLKDIRIPARIPESKRLHVLLKEFREQRQHMAVVIDEYGKPIGLVTIEDVLEEIVGDIEDEHDLQKNPQITTINTNTWLVEGTIEIDEFNNFFTTNFNGDQFGTLNGVLLHHFGHIPQVDETITIDSISCRIIKADPRKIQTVQIAKRQ